MKSKGCGYVENEISRNIFVWVAFKQSKLDKPNQHLEEELFIIFILKLYHEFSKFEAMKGMEKRQENLTDGISETHFSV